MEEAAADGFNATACTQGMRSQKDAVMALVTEAAEAHWSNLQACSVPVGCPDLLCQCRTCCCAPAHRMLQHPASFWHTTQQHCHSHMSLFRRLPSRR